VASSFLFTDTYALAKSIGTPAASIYQTIDLNLSHYGEFNFADLFSGTGSFMTTPTVSDESILSVSSSSAVYISFYAHKMGTTTITVNVNDGSVTVPKTFTIRVIDSALTMDELDNDHNGKAIAHDGFDISDIVFANSDQTSAADLNGDGVVNKTDLEKLISFIPAKGANHSPTAKAIRDQNLIIGHASSKLDLNSYFSDEDGNDLYYRYYSEGTSVTANLNSGSTDLYLYTNTDSEIGVPTKFTVVSEDDYGSSKVLHFNAYALSSGTPNSLPQATTLGTPDLVLSTYAEYDLNQLFTDPDSDNLTYTLAPVTAFSGSIYKNYLSLSYNSGFTDSHPISITASDNYEGTSSPRSFNVELIDKYFNVGYTNSIDLSSFFDTPNVAIVPSTQNNGHAKAEIITSSDTKKYLSIKGVSYGSYTVTVSTTGTSATSKTFVLFIDDPR
jgi:hypothetical protein